MNIFGVLGIEKFKNVRVVLLKQRCWLIETQTNTLASSFLTSFVCIVTSLSMSRLLLWEIVSIYERKGIICLQHMRILCDLSFWFCIPHTSLGKVFLYFSFAFPPTCTSLCVVWKPICNCVWGCPSKQHWACLYIFFGCSNRRCYRLTKIFCHRCYCSGRDWRTIPSRFGKPGSVSNRFGC